MLCTFLTGCSPHTINLSQPPMVEATGQYSVWSEPVHVSRLNWWSAFEDEKLNILIEQAVEHNFGILQAVARLDQATSLIPQAESARLPLLNLTSSFEQEFEDGSEVDRFTRIGGALTWEIDAFNRLGSLITARQSEARARSEDIEALKLSLSAEVANSYFDAVESFSQLTLLKKQVKVDQDLLNLTEIRFNSGLTSSVDVLQQNSQLAETQSLVPPAESALRVAENRLDVLLGAPPDAINRVGTEDAFMEPDALPSLGVPADLLLNRPDLRALKYEMIAADAEIGRAIAERLPQLILNGSLQYEDGLDFSGPVTFLLASFIQPLLDWGARKAEVERNRSLYVERLARFSQRYLEAIEDVENALYQERKQREFLERLERRRSYLEQTVNETTERYTSGLTDFLPVLNAIKELQETERIIVQQKRQLLSFRIQLHRALGGKTTTI